MNPFKTVSLQKHISTGFLLIIVVYASYSQSSINTIDDAMAAISGSQKQILMVFSGSDWCKPCIQLKKEILEAEEFTSYSSERLVQLTLDFPYKKKNRLSEVQKQHNEILAEEFNPQGIFPYMLLMDQNRQVIGTLSYRKGMKPQELIQDINEL